MPAYRSSTFILAQFACDKPECDGRLTVLSPSLSEARTTAELWHEWSTTTVRLTVHEWWGNQRVAVLCPRHVDYRGEIILDPYPTFGSHPPYTDCERDGVRALSEQLRGEDFTQRSWMNSLMLPTRAPDQECGR